MKQFIYSYFATCNFHLFLNCFKKLSNIYWSLFFFYAFHSCNSDAVDAFISSFDNYNKRSCNCLFWILNVLFKTKDNWHLIIESITTVATGKLFKKNNPTFNVRIFKWWKGLKKKKIIKWVFSFRNASY